MPLAKRLSVAAISVLLVLSTLTSKAAAAVPAEDASTLDKVLRQLDTAAANFHSTTADFEFDSVETDPVYDKEVQKGTVYYERNGSGFRMAAHINEINGKPVPKTYTYAGGVLKLYEKLTNQVTTFSKLSQYESWFMLGFGASGKDLEQKWEMKYLGSETVDGVKTEKLEMVAKDPQIRKNIRKVTIWVDPSRGISLKQVFDETATNYRVAVYFNIKVNQPLPGDAFTIKTDGQTQFVNR
jgi:outer membrane lipoprotein-sorting protein